MSETSGGDSSPPLIVVYGQKGCPICYQAYQAAGKAGLPAIILEPGTEVPVKWLILNYPQFESERFPNNLNVPIIVANDELVGGYLDLLAFLENHKNKR